MTAAMEEAQRWNAGPREASDGDQYADSTAIVIDIDKILVADRYRKDIGDVSDLTKSIVEVGLLNPITVWEWHGGYRLVAGERRLTAFRRLGLAEIPARIARDVVDARDALVAERDENTARKPMLLSEATALGIAIEEMEKPAAHDRMVAGTPRLPGAEGLAGHRPRDIAAEAVGMSRATFVRMKTLVNTVDDEEQPEFVREAARAAVEAIDNGAPVRGSYDRVKETKRVSESTTVERPARKPSDKTDMHLAWASEYPTSRLAYERAASEHYGSFESFQAAARTAGAEWRFTERQWQARVATSSDTLNRSILAIEIALSAVAERVDFSTITPDQAEEALERLDRTAINNLIKKLKETSND